MHNLFKGMRKRILMYYGLWPQIIQGILASKWCMRQNQMVYGMYRYLYIKATVTCLVLILTSAKFKFFMGIERRIIFYALKPCLIKG